jgi:predicted P-loop ATPase
LLPSELFPYYAESKLDAGKDDEILMTQKILILDDEFGGKSKLESKRFKELTSKQYFTLREPYGRKNVRLRRMAVLAGTSNETEILNDPTGNRRIIPLEVNRIDFEKYNSCDKVKLLCDAYKLLISGFQYELTKDEIKALNRNTAGFEQVRAEKELVISYIKLPEYQPNGIGIRYMQTTEIKDYIEKQTQQKINIYKLSQELKALGFEQMRRKINGLSSRVWAVVLPERNEIEQEEVVLFGKSNDLDLPF